MDNAAAPPAAPPAPPAAAPSEQDLAHLDTIGVLYYVLAGISALFALFPVIHLIVGIGLIALEPTSPQHGQEARWVGWVFVGAAVALIAFGLTLAALLLMLARRLRQRRGHVFCLVVSGLSCLSIPFGTALGVFSLVVLLKPPIKALFESTAAPAR